MSELLAVYAIWLREFKVFLRERSRLAGALAMSLMWLVFFGSGLGSAVSFSGLDYEAFILPGVVSLSIVFTSVFYGAYIVWDKRFDFLKEVMVAPVSRQSIFLGKALGGVTGGMIQALAILALGPALGISLSLSNIPLALLTVFLLSLSLTSVGLTLGSRMKSPEGFQMIGTFIILPLFFLSGALFPVDNLPPWLMALTAINPLTYGVDALRGTLLDVHSFSLALDLSVLLGFTALMVGVGSLAFERMKL